MPRLAIEFSARDAITKRVLDAVLSGESAGARAEILLNALDRKIAEEPRFAAEILEVLKKSGDDAFIAESIKNTREQSDIQPLPQGLHSS